MVRLQRLPGQRVQSAWSSLVWLWPDPSNTICTKICFLGSRFDSSMMQFECDLLYVVWINRLRFTWVGLFMCFYAFLGWWCSSLCRNHMNYLAVVRSLFLKWTMFVTLSPVVIASWLSTNSKVNACPWCYHYWSGCWSNNNSMVCQRQLNKHWDLASYCVLLAAVLTSILTSLILPSFF